MLLVAHGGKEERLPFPVLAHADDPGRNRHGRFATSRVLGVAMAAVDQQEPALRQEKHHDRMQVGPFVIVADLAQCPHVVHVELINSILKPGINHDQIHGDHLERNPAFV